METENFVAFDLQKEYVRTLRATRVASTVLLLFCGSWCWQQYRAIRNAPEVFENMVQGGLSQLPALTQFAIKSGMALAGISALAVFSALVYNWVVARSLSQVILATAFGAAFSALLVGSVVHFAIDSPLQTVISGFAG